MNPLIQELDDTLTMLHEELQVEGNDFPAVVTRKCVAEALIPIIKKIRQATIAEQERIVKELEEMRAVYMEPVYRCGSDKPYEWIDTHQSAVLVDAIKIIKNEQK